MLTYRYMNSFAVERTGDGNTRKFLPFVNTTGFSGSFEQGVRDVFGSGFAWRIFNTGFREINYAMGLGGSEAHVIFRMYMSHTVAAGSVTFLRFQKTGTDIQVSLRLTPDGGGTFSTLQVWTGGNGDNAQTGGSHIANGTIHIPGGTFIQLEVRVDVNASGAVKVWIGDVLDVNLSAVNTAPAGGLCDRVVLRDEQSVVMSWAHLIVATDDTTGSARIGAAQVIPIRLNADYLHGSNWTPNGGTHHYDRFDDNNPFGQAPDDNTSYLAGSGTASDELYGVTAPSCVAAIRALAINIASKLISGSPTIQPRLLPQDGGVQDFGAAITPESSRYAVQQSIMTLDPDNEQWTDGAIAAAAFGFKASGGDERISLVYLEKVIAMTGESFECGEGAQSYIY